MTFFLKLKRMQTLIWSESTITTHFLQCIYFLSFFTDFRMRRSGGETMVQERVGETLMEVYLNSNTRQFPHNICLQLQGY